MSMTVRVPAKTFASTMQQPLKFGKTALSKLNSTLSYFESQSSIQDCSPSQQQAITNFDTIRE